MADIGDWKVVCEFVVTRDVALVVWVRGVRTCSVVHGGLTECKDREQKNEHGE